MKNDKPMFVIKNKFQKRSELYEEILTTDILADVCYRITGQRDFDCTFDNDGYNKGRMAELYYGDAVAFITFSDTEAAGRNSSFQSVPSAFASFFESNYVQKGIYFYFLPSSGNYETDYFCFMYRLMKTAGIVFLNEATYISNPIHEFVSVNDLVSARKENSARNRGNNSTYVTKGRERQVQVYGKTYGASKYETTLLCIALSRICNDKIELYEICEQDLKQLPARSISIVKSYGVIVIPTNRTMERRQYDEEDSLRSPRYIFNLLEKFGQKHCAFCDCEIPELIQGAHIWPVASIKRTEDLSIDEKLNCAIDGENGIWLCENHHRLFDEDLITISPEGRVEYDKTAAQQHEQFLNYITTNKSLPVEVMTEKFKVYLNRRYA